MRPGPRPPPAPPRAPSPARRSEPRRQRADLAALAVAAGNGDAQRAVRIGVLDHAPGRAVGRPGAARGGDEGADPAGRDDQQQDLEDRTTDQPPPPTAVDGRASRWTNTWSAAPPRWGPGA